MITLVRGIVLSILTLAGSWMLSEPPAAAVCSAEPVVKVIATHGGGTGFVVNGLVVTNAHVVGSSERVLVTFDNSTELLLDVWIRDDDYDLAAIWLPFERPGLRTRPASTLLIGERLNVWGYPYLFNLPFTATYSTGWFSAFRQEAELYPSTLQLDMAINPGNSGSPVLDKECRVVGVIEKRAGQGLAFAISSEFLDEFLNQVEAHNAN